MSAEPSTIAEHIAIMRKLPFAERTNYYDLHIWPDVWQNFTARTHTSSYRALILPGTLQSTTAALLIAALDPERVALLLTADTAALPEQVWSKLERIGCASSMRCPRTQWLVPTGDHADGLAMYNGLREVLEQWHDLPREAIAVDLTGGKSTMTVALSKAAYVLKLHEIYIDSDYDGTQIIEGTQRLSIPPDPFQVFGGIERERAWDLFRNHDYAEAARLFGQLAERLQKVGAPAADDQAAASLAHAYAAWDGFDLAAASDLLRRYATMHSSLPGEGDQVFQQIRLLAPVRELVETQRPRRNDGAAIRRYVAVQRSRLQDAETLGGMLAMFYANAERRAAGGRLDAGALMLYRCLELMSQQRLASHGVLTEYPRDGLRALEQTTPRMEAQYEAAHQRILGRGTYGLPKKITLIAGYVLLDMLHDPFAQRCDIKLIEERTNARNQSILAHGFEYVDAEEYQEFKQVVDATISHWSAVAGVVWPVLLHTCTFASTPPVPGNPA